MARKASRHECVGQRRANRSKEARQGGADAMLCMWGSQHIVHCCQYHYTLLQPVSVSQLNEELERGPMIYWAAIQQGKDAYPNIQHNGHQSPLPCGKTFKPPRSFCCSGGLPFYTACWLMFVTKSCEAQRHGLHASTSEGEVPTSTTLAGSESLLARAG